MTATISEEQLKVLARSGRIELVRTLRAYPDRDFTINELARVSGVPVMTTWRAVKELKRVGLARTRKVGNATSVAIPSETERLRVLKLIPETDPGLAAARGFARRLGEFSWTRECRLFGSISRGDHAPGDEVDVAVVYEEGEVDHDSAKGALHALASEIRQETGVAIAPLLIPSKDMSKKGGLAAELRDKEVIWRM